MFDARWPVHPKGTMVIPMHWRICGYVSCCTRVGSEQMAKGEFLPRPRALTAGLGWGLNLRAFRRETVKVIVPPYILPG